MAQHHKYTLIYREHMWNCSFKAQTPLVLIIFTDCDPKLFSHEHLRTQEFLEKHVTNSSGVCVMCAIKFNPQRKLIPILTTQQKRLKRNTCPVEQSRTCARAGELPNRLLG